ncbi:MAG: 3-dehydroquinate synthase [Alphaproteobacteria bacterium]
MSGRSLPETAGAEPARVRVELGARSYDIVVGEGLIAAAAIWLEPVLGGRRVAAVSDETVAALHLPTLAGALDASGIEHHDFVVPAGEASKDFAHLERLVDALLDARLERGDTVVALGGGVVGDLAGFAASILRRGVAVVQMPTTLLAQVDSAVGGKTGIDTRHGKNLVGSFHQPSLVVADIGVLDTLPRRELLAGYAEVVKYGLIDDPAFFAWLEANGADVVAGDREARRYAVVTSCAAKARIVSGDERDAGSRALLNLGHTFAHALEVETGYGDALLHGEAVAIGMALAFDLSVRLGLCPAEDAERVRRHLDAVGLSTSARGAVAGDAARRLVEHMAQDKKVRAGEIAFVLVHGIGKAYLSHDVEIGAVRALLEESLAG